MLVATTPRGPLPSVGGAGLRRDWCIERCDLMDDEIRTPSRRVDVLTYFGLCWLAFRLLRLDIIYGILGLRGDWLVYLSLCKQRTMSAVHPRARTCGVTDLVILCRLLGFL
jgi:hypothetical protein